MNQLTLGQAASVLEMSVFELAREIKENKIATLSTEGRTWLTVEALETYRARQHSPSAQELQEAGILSAPEIVRIVAVPNPSQVHNPILSNTQNDVSNVRTASIAATKPSIDYLSPYINQYGAAKVKEVQFFLRGCFSKEDGKKLLMADGADKLFTQNAEEQDRYGKRLMATLKKIGTKFLGGAPDKYNCNLSPENFLPGKVEGLEKELAQVEQKTPTPGNVPVQNIAEISAKLGLSPELVRGLIQEGHNVYYLDAITRKGFCLQSPRLFIGGQTVSKSNWENTFRRALASYGCRYEPKIQATEEKLLERIGLVIDHHQDSDGPVSFNPKWSFHTRSLPHLQTYLELYLSPAARRGER